MTTGQKVKYLRQRLGLTQEELANKIGWKTKSSVAHIEQDRDLPIDKIKLIADILGTTGAYLMGWERDPEKVDYVIPANDDATRAVKLIITVLADAIVESKGGVTEIAYTKDEGEGEVTMTDAVKNADQKAEESRQAAKAAYQAKQQARRPRAPRREAPVEAKVEETPVETTEEAK